MANKKISALAEATSLNAADEFVVVQSAANKRITRANLAKDLHTRYETVATADYTGLPTFEFYDGSSFTAISAWAASTAYSLGNHVKPASDNGFIYECVGAGTSGGSEPSFGTTEGADTADNTATWRCRGLHVLTMLSDLTGTIKTGMPIQYVWNSVTYYGIVWAISATRLAVRGAPLKHTFSVTSLKYGTRESVVQLDLFVGGTWGDGVADLLLADQKKYLRWMRPAAYLVRAAMRQATDDTGAEAKAGVKLGGNLALNNDADAGLQLASANWVETIVDLKTAIYQIAPGSTIEIRCTAAGGSGDGSDLSVGLVFVYGE